MTDDIRDAIFQLKKLGWILKKSVAHTSASSIFWTGEHDMHIYINGFHITGTFVLNSLTITWNPVQQNVHRTLFNASCTNEELKNISIIIHSVNSLEDIDDFVRIWEKEDQSC